MTETEKPLIKAIAALRSASPAGYDEFLDALANYAASARDLVLSAPLEALPNAQGRAQSLRALVELVRTAPDKAHGMQNGRK